jgi:uncharacterized membrane protein YiaA
MSPLTRLSLLVVGVVLVGVGLWDALVRNPSETGGLVAVTVAAIMLGATAWVGMRKRTGNKGGE